MVVHAFKLIIQETGKWVFRVQGQLGIHSEFQDSQSRSLFSFKTTKIKIPQTQTKTENQPHNLNLTPQPYMVKGKKLALAKLFSDLHMHICITQVHVNTQAI